MTDLRCDSWTVSFKGGLFLVRVKLYFTFLGCKSNLLLDLKKIIYVRNYCRNLGFELLQ